MSILRAHQLNKGQLTTDTSEWAMKTKFKIGVLCTLLTALICFGCEPEGEDPAPKIPDQQVPQTIVIWPFGDLIMSHNIRWSQHHQMVSVGCIGFEPPRRRSASAGKEWPHFLCGEWLNKLQLSHRLMLASNHVINNGLIYSWDVLDSNQWPLPCQGSALNQLS